MAIKGKSSKQQKKQKNIKRTNSIQEVIKESQSFLKSKPLERNQDISQIQKVTKKIQKKPVSKKQNEKINKQQQQKQQKPNQQQQQQKPQKQQQQQPKKQQQKKLKKQQQQKTKQQQQQQEKQQQQQEQQNNNQDQIQEEIPIGRSRFTEQERENYLNREKLQKGKHELDEHHNFRERYLGREGAFSNFKVLIGNFVQFEQYQSTFDEYPGAELKRRGFKYEIEKDFDKFITKMINYDIVWIISQNMQRTSEQKSKFLEEIEKLFKAKKSLYLWSDNTPFHVETNYILQKYFDRMYMEGKYYGDKIITKGKLQKGQFDETHSIGYGLNNLHEGITICAPQKTHPDFVHFAYNSDNEPLVSYAEENENHGRIILDCGITKMFKKQWNKAGTSQYVSNSNVWLTGIPQ